MSTKNGHQQTRTLHCVLEPGILRDLKALAKEDRNTVSTQVRHALAQYFATRHHRGSKALVKDLTADIQGIAAVVATLKSELADVKEQQRQLADSLKRLAQMSTNIDSILALLRQADSAKKPGVLNKLGLA